MLVKTTLTFCILCSLFACRKLDVIKKDPIVNVVYDFTAAEKILTDNLEKYKGNAVLMVSQNGKIVLNKKWGTFNENTPQPVASATKWLSGAVLMALVDEGKLSLNDSIGKFLPIFTKYKKGNITIRQCFSHTTGFPSETPEGYENDRSISLAACVDLTAQNTKTIAKPGLSFVYGNVGMQIAGRIAEVVSGKSWQELFNQKIGIPCGMSVTYSPLSPKNPRIAGGAVTSARDYLNFLEMIVNKGVFNGKKVLSEQAVSEMLKDQTNAAAIVLYALSVKFLF
jgi:CubicO group peptidase (beta-lactamase class C family)